MNDHRRTQVTRVAPLVASLLAILLGPASGHVQPAQPGRPGAAATYVTGLKAGRWIQLEGSMRRL